MLASPAFAYFSRRTSSEIVCGGRVAATSVADSRRSLGFICCSSVEKLPTRQGLTRHCSVGSDALEWADRRGLTRIAQGSRREDKDTLAQIQEDRLQRVSYERLLASGKTPVAS